MYETLPTTTIEQKPYVNPDVIDELGYMARMGFLFDSYHPRSVDSLQHTGAAVVAIATLPSFESTPDPRFEKRTESEFNAHQNQFALAA